MIVFTLCIVLSGCSAAHHGDAEAFCSHKVHVDPQPGLGAPQSLAELQEREKAPYWKAQEDASLSDCEKTTEAAARNEELSVGQYIQKHEQEEKEAPEEAKTEEEKTKKELQKEERTKEQAEKQMKKEGLIE